MEFTKRLLKSCTYLDLEEYVLEINKLSPEPIIESLLNDLIEISLSKFIHCSILYKYELIRKNIKLIDFLKLYVEYPMYDGHNYYITNNDFKTITLCESRNLHDQYRSVLKYIRWYNVYQLKLNEILELRNKYIKLNNMLLEVKEQYKQINEMKDGTELDILLEKQNENLHRIENEIKRIKTEVRTKLDRIIYN